jgi:type I restriction enzyme R subunit
MEQVENFKENYVTTPLKLANVEDDRDVRNLIYQRLLIAPETSDGDIQVEVMKAYAERYPDMQILDWMRIVRDYTPMVREAAKQPTARMIEMQHQQYGMAAEDKGEYESKSDKE